MRDYHEDLETQITVKCVTFNVTETSMWTENKPADKIEPCTDVVSMDAEFDSLAHQVEQQDFKRDMVTLVRHVQ